MRSLAIALQSGSKDAAETRIVASGHGAVAEQILEIAFARGIKVRSDRDLAQILAAVEVESEIPLSALAAVAEILSYVYRSQGNWTLEQSEDGIGAETSSRRPPTGQPRTGEPQ